MTMRVYKSIYAGGIDAYYEAVENKMDVVISLVDVPKLPCSIRHKIAPLRMDLPLDYQQSVNEMIELMDLCLKNNWQVLVHCWQGEIRSPGVVKAYAKLRDPENAPKETSFSLAFYQRYLTNHL